MRKETGEEEGLWLKKSHLKGRFLCLLSGPERSDRQTPSEEGSKRR